MAPDDDDLEDFDDDLEDDEDDEGPEVGVTIEIVGLSLYTHHGVTAAERLAATVAANVLALERGASVFRVHDVAPTADALAVATATLAAR